MKREVWSPAVCMGFDLIDARRMYVKATDDYNAPIYQMLTELISVVVSLLRTV
jgi:hypothetical protein